MDRPTNYTNTPVRGRSPVGDPRRPERRRSLSSDITLESRRYSFSSDVTLSEQRAVEHEIQHSYAARFEKEGVLLHPLPTKDPLDPLNWSTYRKHTILIIVMWMYFMFTYITTTTVPSFPQIQKLFGIDYAQVNLTVAIPSLGLSLGPLLWSSLSDIYGRRLIFITGTSIAFLATIGTAMSPNFPAYMVARFFQGLGAAPGGTVGMAIINDIFFDYQRGEKLGLWVLAINGGLLIGPIVGGFVDGVSLFWIDWITAILFGLLLLLEFFFLPETLFPRSRIHAMCNDKIRIAEIDMKRTRNLPFLNFRPIPGMPHPKPWDSIVRFIHTFKFPAVVIAVLVYCFTWYWWLLSIITQIPAAYSEYSPSMQGLLFLGLLAGTVFAELFCSGRLSDWIVRRLSVKNEGIREPEMRLWLVYPAALFSAGGLVLWGISVEKNYHWMVGQVAFFFFAIGLQMGNTVIPSYIIDCYPLQSMSVVTFYSVILDLSACINPFFIALWVNALGFTWTFAIQGIITFCVAAPAIGLLHHYGKRLRAHSGLPHWVNPEYDTC